MSIKQRLAYCSIATVLGVIATQYPNELHTSQEGLAHIAKWEQCVSCTYKDHIGVSTIGLGATKDFDGKAPVPGRKLSDDEVARLFMRDIKVAEKCVIDKLNGRWMPQSVFDASVSLIHNTGCPNATYNRKAQRYTQLRFQAEAYNWNQVCYRMGDFIYAGGQKSTGLINRRTDDQRLCLKDL